MFRFTNKQALIKREKRISNTITRARADGNMISTASRNDEVFVEVTVANPARKYDIPGSVEVRIS